MVAKPRKQILIASLLFSIFLCIAVGMVMIVWWQKTTSCYDHQTPLRSFVLTLSSSQEKALAEQSQIFAAKNAFKYHIEFFTPDHEDFIIDMTRKDLEILVYNAGNNLNIYHIGFHNYDC